MKDPYSILGISPSATDEEVKNAYRNLARKYHPDNFDDDNPLKELANEKMQEINAAYDEILIARAKTRSGGTTSSKSQDSYYGESGNFGSSPSSFIEIRQKIEAKKYKEAERMIASVPINDRNAEWHYLNSLLLMHRGYTNDAMRELEMACSMDPGNMEYQQAKEMFNTATRGYGSTYYDRRDDGRAYRRRSTADDACDCCSNLICLDCLCECMGGDLIPCL